MEGEILSPYTTVKQVDDAILRRYLSLVENASAEDLAKLLESWAKYIAARKNSDVFGKEETVEERIEREQRETFSNALKGEQVGEIVNN